MVRIILAFEQTTNEKKATEPEEPLLD